MLLILAFAAALTGSGVRSARPDSIQRRATHVRPTVQSREPTADSIDVPLYARVLQSADERVLDSVVIRSALASSDAEMRRVAARTLSQVALRHRRRAIPMLRELAHDADSSVASSALFGLGLVRDTSSVALLASIARGEPGAASAAAWALGEIGEAASDTIAALLNDDRLPTTETRSTTVALLLAASRVRPLPLPAVVRHLASADAEIRWAAAYAIARQRARAGASALLKADNPDAAFRVELAREITSQVAGDSLHDRALARLRTLVNDADPHVRISAIHSIATFGEVTRPILLRALRDRDANVRVAAAQSAGTAFDTVSVAWHDAWSADTSFKIRSSLLQSAAVVGFYFPEDSSWRFASDWRMRDAAIQAWSGSRDTTRMRSAAIDMTRDPDPRVRGAAYSVLAASDTASRDTLVQRVLLASRSDPDSIVRASVPGARAISLDTAAIARPVAWYATAVRRVVLPSLRRHAPRVTMRTQRGTIVITLDAIHAPLTVLNFTTLIASHFYDNSRFHRVVPGFVAQDGDPRGDGEGGPGYAIRDELTLLPYSRGAVGMALSGPDTGGSQYFLTLAPQPHLTGHYTVFGRVTRGQRVMDSLVEGDAINSLRVDW